MKVTAALHDNVDTVTVNDGARNDCHEEEPVVIPETQMEPDENDEEDVPSPVFGKRKCSDTRLFGDGLFRPQRPSTSSEEDIETQLLEGVDDKENVSPNRPAALTVNNCKTNGDQITTIPETPFLDTSPPKNNDHDSQPLAPSPQNSQSHGVDEPRVFTGVVVGQPVAICCQDNNDDSEDDQSSQGSVPDPNLYQHLPDNVPDEDVIREPQPHVEGERNNGGPPGGDPGGDPDSDPEDDGPYGDPDAPLFNPNGNHNVNNAIVQDRLIQCFAQKFAARRAEVLAGHFIAEGFYAFIAENRQLIYNILRYPKAYKTIRRRADKKLPPISMHFLIRNRQTNEEFWIAGESFPAKDYGNPLEYHVVETWTRISLIDALEMTDEWHHRQYDDDNGPPWRDMTGDPTWIDLSWDGVALDRKNDQVLEVLSMRLVECNRILPLGWLSSVRYNVNSW